MEEKYKSAWVGERRPTGSHVVSESVICPYFTLCHFPMGEWMRSAVGAGTEREAAITGAAGAPAETKEIINITILPRHPALTNLSLSPPENVREEIKTNGLTSPTNRFLDALPQSAASLKEN